MSAHAIALRLLVAVTCAAAAVSVAASTAPANATAVPSAGTFTAVPSVRLVDTRTGLGSAPLGPDSVLALPVLGRAGVPSSGVAAVSLTVTVIGPTASGYVTAWAHGAPRPSTSNVNFRAGQTVAAATVTQVGADGDVALINAAPGVTQLAVDLSGYYGSGTTTVPGGYVPVPPVRLVDTRVPGQPHSLTPGGTLSVTPMGNFTPQSAVVLTVTVVHPAAAGFLTVYRAGTARPPTSDLNFSAGQTGSNLVVAPVNASGELSVYNHSSGTTALVVDFVGYFTPGPVADTGAFRVTTPTRLMDTRIGLGATTPVSGHRFGLSVLGKAGLPTSGVATVTLNVTAVGPKAGGFLSVYPGRSNPPSTSDLNFATGRTVAGLVVVPVGGDGMIDFHNGSSGATPVIADLEGYTLAPPTPRWGTPTLVAPTAGRLRTVSCASPTFCAALDNYGNVLTFDGTSWTDPRNVDVNGGGVVALSCPSPNFCAAVDSAGNGLIYASSVWTLTAGVDLGATPSAISCASSTFCVLVDGKGRYIRFDGAWHAPATTSTTAGLGSISCVSASLCFATTGSDVVRYTGSSWTAPVRVASDGGLIGLSCSAATFCAAITDSSDYTFDGTAWAAGDLLDGEGGLAAISCGSSASCAVLDLQEVAYVYRSGAWTSLGDSDDAGYDNDAVSCLSSTFCMGTNGGVALRYDGSTWTRSTVDPSTGPELGRVSCVSDRFCMALGAGSSESYAYDGTSWDARAVPTSSFLTSVSCASATFCLAGDGAGNVFRYNGTSWSSPSPVGPAIYSISCASETFCLAAGFDSSAQRNFFAVFNGSTWSAPTTINVDPADFPGAVSCTSPTFCASVGAARGFDDPKVGYGLIFDGTAWTKEADIAGSWDGVNSIDCLSPTFCAALDTAGRATVFDGSSWSRTFAVVASGASIGCASSTDCIVVSSSGDVSTFDGTTWTVPGEIDPNGDLTSVSCPSTTFCLAVDDSNHAVSRTPA